MFKFAPYILKSISRNKVRTFLTVFGMMVSVALFCFLVSIKYSMDQTVAKAAENNILVISQKDQW